MSRNRFQELQERTQIVQANSLKQEEENEERISLLKEDKELELELETYKDRVRNSFFEEVKVIEYEIQKFSDIVKNLQTLRQKEINERANNLRERKDLEEIAKASMKVVKKKLYGLTVYCNKIPCPPGENQLRKTQMSALKKKFLTSLESYQKIEHIYKSDLKERLSNQYKDMNPDATIEEVDQAVEKGTVQLNQNLSFEQNQKNLDQVRQRHEEILEIEKSLTELHTLYLDMQSIIILQDQVLTRVDENINTTAHNMELTNEYLDEAVDSSKRSRKMKIWLAVILVALAVIIIVSVISALKFR